MTKIFLALATASTLTVSVAMAQTSNPPSEAQDLTRDWATSVHSSPATSGLAPNESTIAGQTAHQWMASTLKGTQVIGSDDARVGSVNDIVFDRTGSISGVVVGAGGFLGIGAKQIAFPLGSFEIVAGKDGAPDQLKLPMTKGQIAAAPEFKPDELPRTVATGSPARAASGSAGIAPPARSQ
jgi:sporulation protein YlmC with PRC-barrel domain